MDATQPGLFLFDEDIVEEIFLNHGQLRYCKKHPSESQCLEKHNARYGIRRIDLPGRVMSKQQNTMAG